MEYNKCRWQHKHTKRPAASETYEVDDVRLDVVVCDADSADDGCTDTDDAADACGGVVIVCRVWLAGGEYWVCVVATVTADGSGACACVTRPSHVTQTPHRTRG